MRVTRVAMATESNTKRPRRLPGPFALHPALIAVLLLGARCCRLACCRCSGSSWYRWTSRSAEWSAPWCWWCHSHPCWAGSSAVMLLVSTPVLGGVVGWTARSVRARARRRRRLGGAGGVVAGLRLVHGAGVGLHHGGVAPIGGGAGVFIPVVARGEGGSRRQDPKSFHEFAPSGDPSPARLGRRRLMFVSCGPDSHSGSN